MATATATIKAPLVAAAPAAPAAPAAVAAVAVEPVRAVRQERMTVRERGRIIENARAILEMSATMGSFREAVLESLRTRVSRATTRSAKLAAAMQVIDEMKQRGKLQSVVTQKMLWSKMDASLRNLIAPTLRDFNLMGAKARAERLAKISGLGADDVVMLQVLALAQTEKPCSREEAMLAMSGEIPATASALLSWMSVALMMGIPLGMLPLQLYGGYSGVRLLFSFFPGGDELVSYVDAVLDRVPSTSIVGRTIGDVLRWGESIVKKPPQTKEEWTLWKKDAVTRRHYVLDRVQNWFSTVQRKIRSTRAGRFVYGAGVVGMSMAAQHYVTEALRWEGTALASHAESLGADVLSGKVGAEEVAGRLSKWGRAATDSVAPLFSIVNGRLREWSTAVPLPTSMPDSTTVLERSLGAVLGGTMFSGITDMISPVTEPLKGLADEWEDAGSTRSAGLLRSLMSFMPILCYLGGRKAVEPGTLSYLTGLSKKEGEQVIQAIPLEQAAEQIRVVRSGTPTAESVEKLREALESGFRRVGDVQATTLKSLGVDSGSKMLDALRLQGLPTDAPVSAAALEQQMVSQLGVSEGGAPASIYGIDWLSPFLGGMAYMGTIAGLVLGNQRVVPARPY